MKILSVVRKDDEVHVHVPGGCYSFDAEAIPMGFNNATRRNWELEIESRPTLLPFVRVPIAAVLVYRPKEAT